jgi:hypothetical protein
MQKFAQVAHIRVQEQRPMVVAMTAGFKKRIAGELPAVHGQIIAARNLCTDA